MRFGVILLKEYPFSIDEFRKTLTQNGMHPFELSRIKLGIDCAPIRDQLKVNYAGEIPPNTEHNLFIEPSSSWYWKCRLIWVQPLRLLIKVVEMDPLFVACNNLFEETLILGIGK